MYRTEDISRRLKAAVFMLAALLLLSLQQLLILGFFSVPAKKNGRNGKAALRNLGSDATDYYGVMHDNQLAIAVLFAFSLLLALFPKTEGLQEHPVAPSILSPHLCCIVPKGP